MSLSDRARRYAALGDETRVALVDALMLSDRTPAELAGVVEVGSNLLAHHLAVLEEAGLIRRRPSEGDRRRRYVTLVLDHLPHEFRPPAVAARSVLFVCRRNSARSQMAAAMLARKSPVNVGSAGMEPAAGVHPKAVRAAGEVGLELAGGPRGYDAVDPPDLVVSVCDIAGEEPPPFPTTLHLHWSVPDPARPGRMSDFRAARMELERRTDLLTQAIDERRDT